MHLIQRVQRNHQRVRVVRIPVEERHDRRIRLLVQSKMRLRDGEVAPDVVVPRLAFQRLPERLEGVRRLAEPQQAVSENDLERRKLQLRGPGALPCGNRLFVATRRRVTRAKEK